MNGVYAAIRIIQEIVQDDPLPRLHDNEDEWEDWFEDEDEGGRESEYTDYAERHREILTDIFASIPKTQNPFSYAVPRTYDNRFAGKTFVIKGELAHYSKEKLIEIIENFGGCVRQKLTKTVDNCVYGKGIGDSFIHMMDLDTEILSEEYFFDMIV